MSLIRFIVTFPKCFLLVSDYILYVISYLSLVVINTVGCVVGIITNKLDFHGFSAVNTLPRALLGKCELSDIIDLC